MKRRLALESLEDRRMMAADIGDTVYDANVANVSFQGNTWAQVSTIGDNAYGAKDVDMFRVDVTAGQKLVAKIATQGLQNSSSLDAYFRLFGA